MIQQFVLFGLLISLTLFNISCRSLPVEKKRADKRAYSILSEKQKRLLKSPFDFELQNSAHLFRQKVLEEQGLFISKPASKGTSHLPPVHGEKDISYRSPTAGTTLPHIPKTLSLSLKDVLNIAAQSSREYQTQKETVFRSALDLDLTRYNFGVQIEDLAANSTFTENKNSTANSRGISHTGKIGINRKFTTGVEFRTSLALDLVQLLKSQSASALGIVSDTSISIPLLRGSGKHIAGEPLTQAERNVEYALLNFDFFRKTFVVRIAKEYFDALRTYDQIKNAKENYANLQKSTSRVAAIAESGRMPENQVDQSRQDEYRSKLRLIDAQTRFQDNLDRLKQSLALPIDCSIELNTQVLDFKLVKKEEDHRLASLVYSRF